MDLNISYIVSPQGELEVEKYKPNPPKEQFPLYDLQITSIQTDNKSNLAQVVVKNTDVRTATNIQYKITYSETKDGPFVDTDYVSGGEIGPGDTITEEIFLKASNSQYWYNVAVNSAQYK